MKFFEAISIFLALEIFFCAAMILFLPNLLLKQSGMHNLKTEIVYQ